MTSILTSSQLITRGVPQGVIPAPGMFSILDDGTECTTNEFSDRKSNWGGIADPLELRVAVLDSNRLKKWTDGKPTKFNPRHVQSAEMEQTHSATQPGGQPNAK